VVLKRGRGEAGKQNILAAISVDYSKEKSPSELGGKRGAREKTPIGATSLSIA